MNIPKYLPACLLFAATLPLAGIAADGPPSAKPNVIFFLVDDMGWMDSSVYGSTFYKSPGMERLAKSSIRFTNAHSASPLCSPSRASIMSGQYPARHGMTSAWGHGEPLPNEPDYDLEKVPLTAKVLLPYSRRVLATEQYTLAEAFRDAGYRTGFIGKWHMGLLPEYWPEKQGFEFAFHGAPDAGPPSYFSPYKFKAGTVTDGPEGEFLTDRATDEAIKFINASGGKPFFLCLFHWAVHDPFQAKPDLVEHYKQHPDPRNLQTNPTMAAMLHSMDESLVRLLDELERTGLDRNTIIVFTSDNGGLERKDKKGQGRLEITNNSPLRSGKGSLFEGGTRVPALIRWPGVTDSGSVSDAVITGVDYYPTLLEMCGLSKNPEQKIDGVSIAPLLKGGGLDRDAVFCFFPHSFGEHSPAGAWVRQGDWKLIQNFHVSDLWPEEFLLYNLKDDIGETRNLANAQPERTAAMAKLLKDHYMTLCDRPPKPNPAYNPSKLPVGGWVGADGRDPVPALAGGVLTLNGKGISTRALPRVKGALTLRWEMRTQRNGEGRMFWSDRKDWTFKPERSCVFEIKEAGEWTEKKVAFQTSDELIGLRIDCGPGQQPVEFREMELLDEGGTTIRKWEF